VALTLIAVLCGARFLGSEREYGNQMPAGLRHAVAR
jgi:hypothetical protein